MGRQRASGGPGRDDAKLAPRRRPPRVSARDIAETAREAPSGEPSPRRGAGQHLREVVACTPADVRRALGDILSALSSRGVSESTCQKAEVVLAEIMNNVVEHACFDQVSGAFSVEIDVLGTDLSVTVEDDGTPMPDLRLPSGRPHDLAVDLHDLPEGGFGWFLIRELAEDLCYEHSDGRNRLTFRLTTSS